VHWPGFPANVGAVFGIGPTELLVILVIALLVLGPQRLPELARSLGKAIGEFKRATSDLQTELDNARIMLEDETRKAARESEKKKGRGYPDASASVAAQSSAQASPAVTAAAEHAADGSAGEAGSVPAAGKETEKSA
jgi:sec-independent protein translocase protein TatB